MPLVDYFTPLLAIVREFQKAPKDDAATLMSCLDTEIARARRQAIDDGRRTDDFEAALFPVAAWADETLLSLNWPGARDWTKNLLQRRYFNLSTAGIEFFNRLDQLERDANELREVYFLCLCLGFQGRYSYDRNPKALNEIKQQLLSTLAPDPAIFPTADLLVPEGYQSATTEPGHHPGKGRKWRFSPINVSGFMIPLAVIIVLYTIYHLIINYMVNSIIQRL